jgi:hypothetical protein
MNKYLKCAGMSLGLDVAFGVVAGLKDGDLASFLAVTVFSPLVSTLPAIGANVVDKYVNQNISDNKYFQYGATALEAGLIHVGMGEACYKILNNKGGYIKNLIKLECSTDALQAKLFFANAIAQGLLLHYILSQEKANESGNGDRVLFGNDDVNDNNQLDININSNRNESVVRDDDVNNNNIPVTPDYS